MNTAGKKIVNVEIYNQNKEFKYTGRLLGLLSSKEYAAILDTDLLKTKLLNVATTPLSEISGLTQNGIEGTRIAIAVKKRGSVEVMKKILFITEPIEFISGVNSEKDATFVGTNDSLIIIDEEEA